MKQLFGTDGIRGVAGEFPLDKKTVRIIGASLARQFRAKLGREARFVSGRDTRESGQWIETAFHEGAVAENAICKTAGVITTPGIAYLARSLDFDAGVVISASHNPFQDNGMKIFLPTGKKIDTVIEREIERDIHENSTMVFAESELHSGRADEFQRSYIDHIKHAVGDFSAAGIKIVIDCANGAACGLAPTLFTELGADTVTIHNHPDGRNINENCGSTHLGDLQKKVVEENADLGVAFDGDADRALFCR